MTDTTTTRLPLSCIMEPGHRLRQTIDVERLGELADSMAAEGLHQAIGVRGPFDGARYEIVWGHRRLLAAKLLEWREIEAKVFPADYDPLLAAISENLNREQMTPLEEARAVAHFIERGQPVAAVARLFRRSAPWVAQRLDLLRLPEELQQAVHTGELTLVVARALADIDHEAYRTELIAEAKRTNANATTVNVWAAHYAADRDRIVRNHLAVEAIVASRELWKYVIPCQGCATDTAYEETRRLVLCLRCHAAILAAMTEPAPNGANA